MSCIFDNPCDFLFELLEIPNARDRMSLYLTALDTALSLTFHEITCNILDNITVDLILIVEDHQFCLLQCLSVGDGK